MCNSSLRTFSRSDSGRVRLGGLASACSGTTGDGDKASESVNGDETPGVDEDDVRSESVECALMGVVVAAAAAAAMALVVGGELAAATVGMLCELLADGTRATVESALAVPGVAVVVVVVVVRSELKLFGDASSERVSSFDVVGSCELELLRLMVISAGFFLDEVPPNLSSIAITSARE